MDFVQERSNCEYSVMIYWTAAYGNAIAGNSGCDDVWFGTYM
jgi:hypothetical protein